MRQCTATAEVPPVDLLVAILAGQGQVSDRELGSVFGCDHQMGRVSSLSQIIEARR